MLFSLAAEAPGWPLWHRVAAALVYGRLHGHTGLYGLACGERAPAAWARRVRGWLAEAREVHVYFDNTAGGAAPADALRLIDLLARARGNAR